MKASEMMGKKVTVKYTYYAPNVYGKLEKRVNIIPGTVIDHTCDTHIGVRPDSIEVPPCFRSTWISIAKVVSIATA